MSTKYNFVWDSSDEYDVGSHTSIREKKSQEVSGEQIAAVYNLFK
jgi:hypothetical protein